MDRELSSRKLKILEHIIREYIMTAEPVGSRTISKNKDLDVSAATIRNEMSVLEELGLLVQPYTSAGRIPSEEAYKIYVSNMMDKSVLDEEEKRHIKSHLEFNINQISELMAESVELISFLTNYTSIGLMTDNIIKNKIKNISVVALDNMRIVLIFVLEDGQVKHEKILLSNPIEGSALPIIEQLINEAFSGQFYEQINQGMFIQIRSKIKEYSEALSCIVGFLENQINIENKFNLILNGETNIFNYPEFNDIQKAKSFLNLLGEKESLKTIFHEKGIEKNNINILIGDNSMEGVLKDCSIITADYIINGVSIGKVGIIGPKRMNYSRVYSVMSYIQSSINKISKNK